MNRVIQNTADGSYTFQDLSSGITYHSLHGALAESNHVFIEAGLSFYHKHSSLNIIHVLEMGFGTGLNAYLTHQWSLQNNIIIQYETVEKFPLSTSEIENYGKSSNFESSYFKIHELAWNNWYQLDDEFSIYKHLGDINDVSIHPDVDIVFYDAFAPTAQPELWTEELFTKISNVMKPNGILVTYCSKGIVKRALKAIGFEVSTLPGPPRKREMIRAIWKG